MSGLSPWLWLAWPASARSTASTRPWAGCSRWRSGLHRDSERTAVLSVLPIAAGHMVSVAVVALAVVLAGLVVPERPLRVACGLALIGFALPSHCCAATGSGCASA